MSRRWYQIALSDGTATTIAAAEGSHPGEAIVAAVTRLSRRAPVWPAAVAVTAGPDIPLGESVGRGVVLVGEGPAALASFEYPAGVVAVLGERARTAIVAGRTRVTGVDGHAIEAVVAGAGARELFLDVVERLDVVDNVEVTVAEHLDPVGDREVWLTPRLRDVRRAIRFLDDFEDDCLTSGHVDVAAYVRSPRSTWRLTQHKTLVWVSDDDALTARVDGWLAARALPACEPLATIAAGPHVHYRGARSSGRQRLLARLKSAGLRRVDLATP